MAENTFDVIIIGSGPGGYVTAIRAAQLGLKACVVEKQHLGGICLNWGCIPTKALLRSAEIFHTMTHAGYYGLSAKSVGFDLKKVIKRSRGISDQLNKGVGYLLKKNMVAVIDGEAKLNGPGKVKVAGNDGKKHTLSSKHVIIATGARPRALPGLEPDGKQVWTYFEALVPDTMPKSLLVIGSGAIGIEFASFFNTLGAKVTVIEVLERRGCRLPVIIEPGRAIVGNAGVLLTRVEYLKYGDHRNFAVVDAGMNDLLRPALYQGFHEIMPLQQGSASRPRVYDVVGPVCESADFLGHQRSLAITEGDLLALRSVGAYGFVMSSTYNSRVRSAEVIVDGDRFHVVRKRETVDQLMENECLFPG